MYPSRSSTCTLLKERGMTWVTALLLLILVVGGYLAWVWIPVWVSHFEVKQVVRDYCNQAVKNPNDAELIEKMLHKLRVIEQMVVVDSDGQSKRVPVIQVQPANVVWERNPQAATLHVAFEYVREVRYPLFDRSVENAFQVDITVDIVRPDWGPPR